MPKQSPSTKGQNGQKVWTRNRECAATNFKPIYVSLIILEKSKPESASIQIRSVKTASFYFHSQNF
jgi:hypothetical protein